MWDIIGGVGVTRRSTPGRCNPAKALADKLADNSELETLLAHLVSRLHATEFSTFFKILLARLELQKEEKLKDGIETEGVIWEWDFSFGERSRERIWCERVNRGTSMVELELVLILLLAGLWERKLNGAER